MKKKLFAILMMLSLVMSFMPSMAFADADILTGNQANDILTNTQSTNQASLLLQAKAVGKHDVKLTWNKAEGATKYVVYGAKCGNDIKKLAAVKGTKYTVKKISKKSLKAHKTYKFYVRAYKGNSKLAQSKTLHFITANTMKKYANVTKMTAKKSLNLEVGKTANVNAKYSVYKNKKHLPATHRAAIKYMSSNTAVATVNASGKVTAKAEGTATIYSQDVGGKYAKTKVSVKLSAEEQAFEAYKQELLAQCDGLLQDSDSDEVKQLIEDAKKEILNAAYDSSNDLNANRAMLQSIFSQFSRLVREQRDKDNLPDVLPSYTVTFDINYEGKTSPDPQTVKRGKKAHVPNFLPAIMGYAIEGWYTTKADDGTLSGRWDFETDLVKKNMTLYANWARTTLMSDVLPQNTIPASDSMPAVTWVSTESSDKCYVKNGNIVFCDKDGNIFFTLSKLSNMFNVGGNYVYRDNDSTITFTMEDGKLVNIVYEGKNPKKHLTFQSMKGRLITLEGMPAGLGLANVFRVIKVDGDKIEVLAMSGKATKFSTSYTTTNMTGDLGTRGIIAFAGSNIDTYLNGQHDGYYSELSSAVQNAITEQSITYSTYSRTDANVVDECWAFSYLHDDSSTGTMYIDELNMHSNPINRKVYLLGVEDIVNYLGEENLTHDNILEMFWNDNTLGKGGQCWLRDAYIYLYEQYGSTDGFVINRNRGFINNHNCTNENEARAVFTIDLSKCGWELWNPTVGYVLTDRFNLYDNETPWENDNSAKCYYDSMNNKLLFEADDATKEIDCLKDVEQNEEGNWVYKDEEKTVIFKTESSEVVSINYSGVTPSKLDGEYLVPPTIGDIIATVVDFPTDDRNSWRNDMSPCECYLYESNKLYFTFLSDKIPVDLPLSAVGENWKCVFEGTYQNIVLTFVMNNGVLDCITVAGVTEMDDGPALGTYRPVQ